MYFAHFAEYATTGHKTPYKLATHSHAVFNTLGEICFVSYFKYLQHQKNKA